MATVSLKQERTRLAVWLELTPGNLGVLTMILLIFCGLYFRTYDVTMADSGVEFMRQWGLPFIIAEIAVIIIAMRNGFNLTRALEGLPKAAQILLAVFFGTFWIGAAFFSIFPHQSSLFNVSTVIHLMFALALAHSSSGVNAVSLDRTLQAIGIGMSMFAIMTVFAFIYHPPLSDFPPRMDGFIDWQFSIPGFISVRLFGAFCGALLTFALAKLIIDGESGRVSVWTYWVVFLLATLIIWTGTRAAVLGLIISGLIGFFAFRMRANYRIILSLVALAIFSTFTAYLLVPSKDPNIFFLFHFDDFKGAQELSGGRMRYWQSLWHAILEKPFFGAGPVASMWVLGDDQARHVQPHNIILQFLITWGVFAGTAALVLLGWAVRKCHQIAHSERQVLPFMLTIYCMLVMSMMDGMFHFAQHLMLTLLCFGLIFATHLRKSPSGLLTQA
jgi:exopolysaccharide production protein ExoQ